MSPSDYVGLVGVVAYLAAYALAQLGRLEMSDIRYAILNLVGGAAILYSLIWSFNLASFITQVAWIAFTVIGMLRHAGRRDPGRPS